MRRSKLTATLTALVAVLAGCGGGEDGDGPEVLRVYVSLPLSGPAAPDGRDAADGARLALDLIGDEVDGAEVEARFLDAGAPGTGWSPDVSAANARTAIRDSTAIAYVGDFQSGATRASLPITNEAYMLQVSPASGAADLVVEFAGSDEISELQTTGERTFGRVIPADELQKDAARAWESRRDAFRVVTDRALSPYTSESFERGSPPLYATSAALDPSHLPPEGRDFARRFEQEYGRSAGRYAAYGYEAMAVVLDSLERADDPADRQTVVEAFFETSGRDSILGRYSITETGETTLARISGYVLRAGEARPETTLEAP